MSVVATPPVPTNAAPPPPVYRPRWTTIADLLHELGDVHPDRVRMQPHPGTAAEADAFYVNERECLCELVSDTLVEKPMSAPEGYLAMLLGHLLLTYVLPRQLGAVIGADAQFRMRQGNLRLPDVSFTVRERMPNPIPQIGGWCPDLCIEILSPSNTAREMLLKRQEYFASGCQLVWEIDPRTRSAVVYTSATDPGRPTDAPGGDAVLPGYTLPLAQLFAAYEAGIPPASA